MADQITIPLSQHVFGPLLLGGLVLFAVFFWSGAGRALMGDRMAQRWSMISPAQRAATGVGLAIWAILLLATLAAALVGVLRMVSDTADGNLGLGTLLAALLGAPFLIWATLIRQATVDYQKEGHMTDRISKAVEQLGAEKTVKVRAKDAEDAENKNITIEETKPNLEVRIGAILSLERIAQDSTRHDRGRDHVRVMEILCTYIRLNFPSDKNNNSDNEVSWIPRIDLQTALDVLRRRLPDQIKLEHSLRFRLNLSNTNLERCDLSSGNFFAADFTGARLVNSFVYGANFNGAIFNQAYLSSLSLKNCEFFGTYFFNAHLSNLGIFGFSVARNVAVLIEGACVEDLHFTSENAQCFFGSKDTKLSPEYSRAKRVGEILAQENLWIETGSDADDFLERRLSEFTQNEIEMGKRFLHWSPFRLDDMASGFHRDRYFSMQGIHGWPWSL